MEPEILYYLFAEKDPHCSCCNWEYRQTEHETEKGALEEAKDLENDGFTVWLIHGKDLLQYDSAESILT